MHAEHLVNEVNEVTGVMDLLLDYFFVGKSRFDNREPSSSRGQRETLCAEGTPDEDARRRSAVLSERGGGRATETGEGKGRREGRRSRTGKK